MISAIILAAGRASRMGQPKQLLPIEGEPLLVRTIKACLAAPVWPVVVVLGAHAEQIRPALAKLPVLATENEAWPEGMASSVRAGITTLEQFSRAMRGAVLVVCDQPAFSAEAIQRLIDAQKTTGASVVAARYADQCGTPALFLKEHFAELHALTGEEGARALFNAHAHRLAAVDLPELALDLDTPEQLAAWQKTSQA
jgi:CTP:molybdopterin cytidylyltransferase MocA